MTGGGVTNTSSGTEKERTRMVNVAPTQVKLQEKPKNRPSRGTRKQFDAVIHDKLLNGTGGKSKAVRLIQQPVIPGSYGDDTEALTPRKGARRAGWGVRVNPASVQLKLEASRFCKANFSNLAPELPIFSRHDNSR